MLLRLLEKRENEAIRKGTTKYAVGQNKVESKELKRVKKSMNIEDPERIQEDSQREEQQRLPDLKSQTRVKNFIQIQDPESMQHIDLKRSQ